MFHTAGPVSQIVLTLPAKHMHMHIAQLTRGSPLAKISATGVSEVKKNNQPAIGLMRQRILRDIRRK